MDKISMTLTVYFEEGFWHGLFEQEHAQSYRVCRVTFVQSLARRNCWIF